MNFIVAGDLGKRNDPSTISIAQVVEEILPAKSLPGTWQEQGERRMTATFIHIRRFFQFALGTPYSDIIAEHKRLVEHPKFAGNVDHIVDATGVGEFVVERMRDEGMVPAAVYFTSGTRLNRPDERKMDFNVPKVDIAMAYLTWHQDGRVRINIGHDRTAEGKEQKALYELYDYQRAKFTEKVTKSHNRVFENENDEDHDDLVIVAALPCWWASIHGLHEAPAPIPTRKEPYDPRRRVEYGA